MRIDSDAPDPVEEPVDQEEPVEYEEPEEQEVQVYDASYTIIAEGLSKDFDDGDEIIKAVDNVSFTCSPHQLTVISGASGCGKSTLLYLLGSLERPTEGQLIIDGVEVTALAGNELNRFRRSKIGFVFQSFHLIPNLTAVENVMLPMDIAGVPRAEQVGRAQGLLEQVGIDANRFKHRPSQLSGGQQQRVAIARALANDPAVILADEPTGNLDTKNSKRIVELLRQLARQGRTIVVVTHEASIAKQADLHIELEDGQIVSMSTKGEEATAPAEAPQQEPPRRMLPRRAPPRGR